MVFQAPPGGNHRANRIGLKAARPGEGPQAVWYDWHNRYAAEAPMPGPTFAIFVSYRRDDSEYIVGHLKEELEERLPGASVFVDISAIPLGADFRAVLDKSIEQCDVVLAVIGKQWLNIANADGQRRLDDPDDFVRLELQAALAKDKKLIPVLVSGTRMPVAEQLPADLQPLAFKHALDLRPGLDFRGDIRRLVASLQDFRRAREPEVGPLAAPQDLPPSPPVVSHRSFVTYGLVLTAAVVVAWILYPRSPNPQLRVPSADLSPTDIRPRPNNHPPTISLVRPLKGAIEDTPFLISYDRIKEIAQTSDDDQDRIEFRCESVASKCELRDEQGALVKWGKSKLSPGQSWTWTPPANQFGLIDACYLCAWDGQAASLSLPVKVEVAPDNDPPTIMAVQPFLNAIAEQPYSITYEDLNAKSRANDPEGDKLTFRIEEVLAGGLVKVGSPVVPGKTSLDVDEAFVWTSAANTLGEVQAFSLRAIDAQQAASKVGVVVLNVTPAVLALQLKEFHVKKVDLAAFEEFQIEIAIDGEPWLAMPAQQLHPDIEGVGMRPCKKLRIGEKWPLNLELKFKQQLEVKILELDILDPDDQAVRVKLDRAAFLKGQESQIGGIGNYELFWKWLTPLPAPIAPPSRGS